jgi:hypothetical protein
VGLDGVFEQLADDVVAELEGVLVAWTVEAVCRMMYDIYFVDLAGAVQVVIRPQRLQRRYEEAEAQRIGERLISHPEPSEETTAPGKPPCSA